MGAQGRWIDDDSALADGLQQGAVQAHHLGPDVDDRAELVAGEGHRVVGRGAGGGVELVVLLTGRFRRVSFGRAKIFIFACRKMPTGGMMRKISAGVGGGKGDDPGDNFVQGGGRRQP